MAKIVLYYRNIVISSEKWSGIIMRWFIIAIRKIRLVVRLIRLFKALGSMKGAYELRKRIYSIRDSIRNDPWGLEDHLEELLALYDQIDNYTSDPKVKMLFEQVKYYAAKLRS